MSDTRHHAGPRAAVDLDRWDGPVVQTPCSTVYLPAPGTTAPAALAYKVRKPVNLGYLDFSTLASRRRFGEEEVRLNADLAPGVYLRVAPVVRAVDGSRRVLDGPPAPPPDEVIDWAVVMRALPAEGMLAARLAAPFGSPGGALTDDQRRAIVARLAGFHSRSAFGPEVSRHGEPEAIRRELLTNLDQSAGLPGISGALLERVGAWMGRQLDALAPLMARRVAGHRIREGHGDLHAGNICFDPAAATPDNPTGLVIYDRLEFREDFRCRDVSAELACLASTLIAHGAWDDAGALVAEYAGVTGDPDLLALQPLYRAHYAMVRAKVHAMRAAQADCAAGERADHLAAARARLNQAAAETLGPLLILTCGLPGSGKSFASRALSAALHAEVARADEIRKALAGLGPTDRGGPDLYTPEMSRRTYGEALVRCAASLSAGRRAIADATFRSRALRAPFIDLAAARGASPVIVHCRADAAESERRLEARSTAGADASDADVNVYRAMRATFEDPAPDEAPIVEMTPGVSTAELVGRVILAAGQA